MAGPADAAGRRALRIALDLQSLQSDSVHRGVGQYVLALAGALSLRDDVVLSVLLNRTGDDPGLLRARRLVETAAPRAEIHTVEAPWPWPGATFDPVAHRLAAEVREQFVRELAPDVVLIDNVLEPPFSSVLPPPSPSPAVARAAILYDLIPLEQPVDEAWSAEFTRDFRARLGRLRHFDVLLCISAHTADKARELLDLPIDRLVVIGGGPGPVADLAAGTHDPVEDDGPGARSGLVFVGAEDARKNEEGLLRAYAALPAAVRSRHPLVLVGDRSSRALTRTAALRRQLGLARKEVITTGRLDRGELARRYASSRAAVLPSYAEGLGLPILEAWAFGTPVVASNRTSLPEVVGEVSALFDPSDIGEMSSVLLRVLTDDRWWTQLRQQLSERRADYTWDGTAQRVTDELRALVTGRATGGLSQHSAETAGTGRRLRLALVSPWPPQATGVARHGEVMAQALAAFYDVTVVAPAGHERTPEQRFLAPGEFLRQAATFDRVLFQIGNSLFHQFLVPLMRVVPGVVVMHDVRLTTWLTYVLGEDSEDFRVLAYREGGLLGWRDRRLTGIELVRPGVGLLVHSKSASKLVTGGAAGVPEELVGVAPMVDLSEERIPREQARGRLGLSDHDVLVATFGRVHPTKRTMEFLQAAIAAAEERPSVRVAVVGGDTDRTYLAAVRRLATGRPVTLTGAVPPKEYSAWLAAADIVVQLRSDDNGESSAALVEAMAAGAAVIVEDTGSLRETVGDVGIVVGSPADVEDLRTALVELVDDRARRTRLAELARTRAESVHGSAAAARAYRDVLEHHYARHDPRQLIEVVAALPLPRERKLAALAASAVNRRDRAARRLVIDVSDLLESSERTGIQRVEARLAEELICVFPGRVLHGRGTSSGLRETLQVVGGATGDATGPPYAGRLLGRPGDWLLSGRFFPHADRWERHLQSWRATGGRVAHIVHDILPVTNPHWFPASVTSYFPQYLDVVLRNSDLVLAISSATLTDLERYAEGNPIGWDRAPAFARIRLGADLGSAESGIQNGRPGRLDGVEPTVLMVGTVEPRKGHLAVLKAFKVMWRDGVAARLVVVGRPGWGPPRLHRELERAAREHPSFEWRQTVNDAQLNEVYRTADLMLAASEGEGFGLPLVEAAHAGLQVLARDIPVFREVMGGAVDYFSDDSPAALAAAVRAALDRPRTPLDAIAARPVTWRETVEEAVRAMLVNR